MNFMIFVYQSMSNYLWNEVLFIPGSARMRKLWFFKSKLSKTSGVRTCILVRPFRPTKWYFQIFQAFFLKCSWNSLSGTVLFVIFWHRISLGWFFKFWHTLSLLCSASSSISPNMKIYSLGKFLLRILEIFLEWPSSSYLSNGVLSTF